MSSSKFSGSAKVLKELQGLAGFVSYEACFCQGSSMTTVSMENMMEAQYFGDPVDDDSIGLADQLVNGLGFFGGLYNEELLQNSITSSSDTARGYCGGERDLMRSPTPTLSSHSSSGLVRVIKPELHCLGEDKKIVVSGTNGLKLSTMLASGLTEKAFQVNIKGRTLLSRSREILKNCKKALALVLRHDSPYKSFASTGLLPSGMCRDDYLLFVRQKMYVALLPTSPVTTVDDSNAAACANDSKKSDDLIHTSMPDNYLFPGYLVFAMMGPIVPHEMRRFQSHLIMEKPPPKLDDENLSSKGSQAASKRKRGGPVGDSKNMDDPRMCKLNKKVEVKQESGSGTSSGQRVADSSSSPKDKTYTVNQQLQIAAMAQAKKVIDIRERSDLSDRIVAMHKHKVAGKKALIEELKFLITNSSSDDPDRAAHMTQLKGLHHDLAMALDELALTERSIIDTAMMKLNADSATTPVAAGTMLVHNMENVTDGNCNEGHPFKTVE